MTALALRSMPDWASPLDDTALAKLEALMQQTLTIAGKSLLVKEYLESLYPRILVHPQLKLTTYLRGSYAAYVIDPVKYLEEALEAFYLHHPEARGEVRQKYLEFRALKPALEEPKDADFADLFFHSSLHIDYPMLEKMQSIMLRWGQTFAERNPFELNIIPKMNDITRTAEEIVISTLKNDDPQALKIDRIIGRLDNYCLFTRDNIYIDYRNADEFVPFPLSMGLKSAREPYSFWQSILDREMNIIRMERKHENDFCSVLAAIEHYSKGATIDESEIKLEDIYRSFLPCLTDERLLTAVLKRIKDHSVDPLSYLFHFCNKMPADFQAKRDRLWQSAVKELGKQKKLGKFPFLESSLLGFNAFRNELAHWMSKGFKDFGSHHFRIAPKQQEEMTQMQRHFRKMMLLENPHVEKAENQDFWMHGVNALHHPQALSVLSQEFVYQLLEDMTSNDVYNQDEIGRVLLMGERYFGKVNASDWLEGLLQSSFAKTVLPFWEQTQMAISQEERWIKLAQTMPTQFHRELLDRFYTLFDSLDIESKAHFLIRVYPQLIEMDKSKAWDLLKQVNSSIGSISDASQKTWSAWACECIVKEKQDFEAVRLFLLFSRVCDLGDLPKKQRNRIEYALEALALDQKSDYIELLIEKGELNQALHHLPKEASALLDKALSMIPQMTQEQFAEFIAYSGDYVQFFKGHWHEIVMQLDIERQRQLLQILPLEIAEECKSLGLINPSIFLYVMEKKFGLKPSVPLFWAIERAQGHVDAKQSAQVLRSYQQSKEITLDDKTIIDRLNWLLDQHKYRDCFTLLEKAKTFTQGAHWNIKCSKAFLENASLDELNQSFMNERMIENLIIPQGIIPFKIAQEEDLKGCLAIYQKLKSRLSQDDQCACARLLLEKQCNKPLRHQRDQMHLMIECLPFVNTNLALFRQAHGFEWMKNAAQSKDNSQVRDWLVQEMQSQSLMACDPSIGRLLLEIYYAFKIPAPLCLKEALLEGLNTPTHQQEADYHRWLFDQLIDKAPSLIERLNIDTMPIIHLFEKICQIVPNHFSMPQLWQFIDKLSHSPDEQLKLIKAWHSRSPIEDKILQQHVLEFSPSAKSLIPFLKWMDELGMEPIAEWDQRWKEFDENQLSLFLKVCNKVAKNRFAVIEHAISGKFSGLCFQNAAAFFSELQGNPSLLRQLNEMILERAQSRKEWNFEQAKNFLICFEFQTDEMVANAYKLCGFEALLSIYEKDRDAEKYLLDWLQSFNESDVFLRNLSEQGIIRVSKFLQAHYERIFNHSTLYHPFFGQLFRIQSPSEEFVSNSLMMWDEIHPQLRMDMACLYMANHPQSIDSVINSLLRCMLETQFSLEDYTKTSERLSVEYPEKDFSISKLVEYTFFVKKAMVDKDFVKATMYMFGYFTIVSEIAEKGVYQLKVEPILSIVISRLIKHLSWEEVDLLFMRYVLFCYDPMEKVDYNPALELHYNQFNTSTPELHQMTSAVSAALLFFAQEGYQILDLSYLNKYLKDGYSNALATLNQQGQPIPDDWFPYYNSFNSWLALQLEKFVENAHPEEVLKMTSSMMQILRMAWDHPGANPLSFRVFYQAISSILKRPDCNTAGVTLLSSFLFLDSMVSNAPFKLTFEFITKDPVRFGVFLKHQLQTLIKLTKERDSHLNQLRVFRFINYLASSFPRSLEGQEEDIMKFLYDFKNKLPNRTLDFQRQMMPAVHDSVRILRNSGKYPEQQLMRFCKSLESNRVKQDL